MISAVDLLAERRKTETRLADLKAERGRAVLDGQPFDGARITEVQAALEAVAEAEAEVARRQESDAAAARQRILDERVVERRQLRERYLAAIGAGQEACSAYIAAMREAVALGAQIVEADDDLAQMVPGSRPSGFRVTPVHDREAVCDRLWNYLRAALREGLGTVSFGPIDLPRYGGDPNTSDDWRSLEAALDAAADRAADRAPIP